MKVAELPPADASDPKMLLLFVQFYWALLRDRHGEDATKILNKERGERGYVYLLNNPKQTSRIEDDAFQSGFNKVPGSIPRNLKFRKTDNAEKDVPGCPEREGESSSQTCPPSLDSTSLSETRQIGFNPSTTPLPPDSQNTNDLPEPRKRRQTSPDIPRKKHRRTNEATSDASKLGDDNDLIPQSQSWSHSECKEDTLSLSCPPVASSTSESTKFELHGMALSFPSNAPVPNIHDPQRGLEAHPAQGKQKSRSFRATKKTPVMAPLPKDATLQCKQHGTTGNPKKRRASSSEGHQRKRREVPVDQEDSVPITVQADLVKRKKGRPLKLKEGQEGSASNMPFVSRKKKDRLLESKVLSLPRAQLNAGTVVPFSGQNVNMTQEISITSRTHFFSAQLKRQEVPVDQESSISPDLVGKKGGRSPKVKEGQEGSASMTAQLATKKAKDRPLKSQVLSLSQAQLNAGTVVPFLKENVDMKQETSITSCIPFSPTRSSHGVSGLILDRGTKEEIINHSENWWSTQEHGLVEDDSTLDCEAPAATQMEDHPTDIFPTQKPPLCVNPPIWAQVRDNTLRHNELSSTFLSSPAKKFVKPLIGFGAIRVAFILRTM